MPHRAWLKQNKQHFTLRDFLFLEKHSGAFTLDQLEEIKRSYLQNMPMAYLLGKEEFYGLEFKIDKRVLIPRPETELLVEKALSLIREKNIKTVLDVGCGSGVIAIVLKKYLPGIIVTACDISRDAITVARENAARHNIEIEFVLSDVFTSLSGRSFDLIVSNPPYVDEKDATLELGHEPREALYARDNGLAVIKKLIAYAPGYLTSPGYFLSETGYDQKDPLNRYIDDNTFWEHREWIKDYQGHNRVICLSGRKAV